MSTIKTILFHALPSLHRVILTVSTQRCQTTTDRQTFITIQYINQPVCPHDSEKNTHHRSR